MAIKLDKYFFKLEFDLFLVCFYVSPATSSMVKRNPDYTDQTFHALNTVSHKLMLKGEVILCGDANSRTASPTDFVTCHNTSTTHDIYDEIGLETLKLTSKNHVTIVTKPLLLPILKSFSTLS